MFAPLTRRIVIGAPWARREGIGNVGLERDARADPVHAGTVQRAHEHLGGEVHVAVLLHVEVDELGNAGAVRSDMKEVSRRPVEHLHALAQHVHGVLARQRGDLRVDRRDLDRHHLDLRHLQALQDRLEPPCRLALAEDRLPEEVHVHAHALGATIGKVSGEQLRVGRQDDVGGLLPDLRLDQRHRDAGGEVGERLEALEHGAVEGPEEPRDALDVQDVHELVRHSLGPLRAECLVGDLRQRRLVGGALQHPVELRLLVPLRRRLQRERTLLQLGGE
jgi:hypothetical protein